MFELSGRQSEAVESKTGHLAITAGAGSGKTTVLVERVKWLLAKKEATLDEILAITFTEKAASELKERLAKNLNDPIGIANSFVGTFHSFCARILREHGPIIGIDPDFAVLEDYTAGILLRKAVKETVLKLLEEKNPHAEILIEELEFKDALSCLEELLSFRWHTSQMTEKEIVGDEREIQLTRALFYCFVEAGERYRLLKGNNLDFQDLEIESIKLLKIKEIGTAYTRRFKHILVDEFQDINDTQAELIALLFNEKTNPATSTLREAGRASGGVNRLTIVGDSKQSIYRFRGANLHRFESALKGASQSITLSENYRSCADILEFINGLFKNFEPLKPVKKETGPSVYKLTINAEKRLSINGHRILEAEKIADIIPTLSGSTACLFYSLNDANLYAQELANKGIPYLTHGSGSFFESQEIIDILHALRIASDRNDLVALLGLMKSPYMGFTDEEIICLSPISFDSVKKVPKASVLGEIERYAKVLNVSELIRLISKDRFSDNLTLLCRIVDSLQEKRQMTLVEICEYLKEIKDKGANLSTFPEDNKTSVILLTIHQAKGLEFDNVILCDSIRSTDYKFKKWAFVRGASGTTDIAFKLTNEENPEGERIETEKFKEVCGLDRDEDALEKERLLYVALTRAKNNVILPLHQNISRDGKWHKLLLEYADRLPEYTTSTSQTTGTHTVCVPTTGTHTVCVPASCKNIYSVSELEDYLNGPEKYFYKYIIGTPPLPIRFGRSERLSPTLRGDIVHKVIEYSSKYKSTDIPVLMQIVLNELEIGRLDGLEQREISDLIEGYFKTGYANANNSKNEVPFLIRLENGYLTGILDMLIEGPSWEIVDFKTGSAKDMKKELEAYDLQVKSYALAVAKRSGIYNGRVTLLFLTKDGAIPHSVEISKKEVIETETRLNKLIDSLQKEKWSKQIRQAN